MDPPRSTLRLETDDLGRRWMNYKISDADLTALGDKSVQSKAVHSTQGRHD